MANEKIKLIKDYSPDNDLDRSFSELIPKKNRITTNEFFDYYNHLFYDIPQEGANSHTELVNQSTPYIGNYSDPRDLEIIDLNTQINALNMRVNELEQGEFESDFDDLTTNVVLSLKLKNGDWPDNFDRVYLDTRKSHRIIIDDYINEPIYFQDFHSFFENKTFEFKTTAPTFTVF